MILRSSFRLTVTADAFLDAVFRIDREVVQPYLGEIHGIWRLLSRSVALVNPHTSLDQSTALALGRDGERIRECTIRFIPDVEYLLGPSASAAEDLRELAGRDALLNGTPILGRLWLSFASEMPAGIGLDVEIWTAPFVDAFPETHHLFATLETRLKEGFNGDRSRLVETESVGATELLTGWALKVWQFYEPYIQKGQLPNNETATAALAIDERTLQHHKKNLRTRGLLPPSPRSRMAI